MPCGITAAIWATPQEEIPERCEMLMPFFCATIIAVTWILALETGTQNAFGAAILMTFAAIGVLVIHWILNRIQDRPRN